MLLQCGSFHGWHRLRTFFFFFKKSFIILHYIYLYVTFNGFLCLEKQIWVYPLLLVRL